VFTGAGAEVTIGALPFVPTAMKFWATGGVWGVKFVGHEGMAAASYLSNTAADEGVTINTDKTVTIANGADVNVSGELVYYEAIG
jgi:hypothetical protein